MEKIHLDLKVPKGWAYCSTRELEMIAEEMIRSQMVASLSRFHPFDWTEIKTRLFFRFSNVQILDVRTEEQNNKDRVPEEQNNQGQENMSLCSSVKKQKFACRHGEVEFELETWQVHSFLEQLAWLDAVDSKGRPLPMPKLMWPYPERIRRWWPLWKRECFAPGELLDGMTWQTYRWINDWMEAYTNTANALVDARTKREDVATLARQEQDIRLTVLSLVFGCKKWRIRLARIGEVEWQVVMFWWSSMMQYLKEQYPKCFKAGNKKSRSRAKQPPLPIELYTRSMATLQKYLGGLTEDEINAQTAHAILRHLNDMALEAEEMEKIRRKRK